MPAEEKNVIIKLQNGKEVIYVRAKAWGMTGDHEEIVFSEEKRNTTDTSKDYVFYTSTIFYKIENENTLTIYAPESSISEPSKVFSKAKINIRSFTSEVELTADTANFQKLNLQKVSVYPY